MSSFLLRLFLFTLRVSNVLSEYLKADYEYIGTVRFRYAVTLIKIHVKNKSFKFAPANIFVRIPDNALVTKFAVEDSKKNFYLSYNTPKLSLNDSACQTVSFEECSFPFSYEGETYNQCTNVNDDKYFCSKHSHPTQIDSLDYCGEACLGNHEIFRKPGIISFDVVIKPGDKFTYHLVYEELITRVAGNFNYKIYLTQQNVNNTLAKITIEDNHPIHIATKFPYNLLQNRVHERKFVFSYEGVWDYISNRLRVRYDVIFGGNDEILVDDYFIHSSKFDKFASWRKHVVFIIDSTKYWNGYGGGRPILRAISRTIARLNVGDFFNIIATINNSVRVYPRNYYVFSGMFRAEREVRYWPWNISHFMSMVKRGFQCFKNASEYPVDRLYRTMYVFNYQRNLSEQDANAFKEQNVHNATINMIYVVSDYKFKIDQTSCSIAQDTLGFCRKIDRKEFPSELNAIIHSSDVKMKDVELTFRKNEVLDDYVVAQDSYNVFRGRLAVHVGYFDQKINISHYQLSGSTYNGTKFVLRGITKTDQNYYTNSSILSILPQFEFYQTSLIERMWAHVVIRNLISESETSNVSLCQTVLNEKNIARNLAIFRQKYVRMCNATFYGIFLSMKYGFHTKFTNLIIVLPGEKHKKWRLYAGSNKTSQNILNFQALVYALLIATFSCLHRF